MCGIVGVEFDSVKEGDIDIIKQVFLETEIRGKHASGIAWFDGTKLNCITRPKTISKLLKEFDLKQTIYNNKIRLIGHIRYSTSDIKYNQPIGDGNSYIVHNGVICQQDPSNWSELYGYYCETKNDSELLFHCIKNDENYLDKFSGCSVSALYLDEHGIKNFRNSLRPQWVGYVEDRGKIIASTKNILLRSGIYDVHKVTSDDSKELINRDMDELYKRIQTVL
jgi:glutamine phosphoribosylpyrophosphate amidotransferase